MSLEVIASLLEPYLEQAWALVEAKPELDLAECQRILEICSDLDGLINWLESLSGHVAFT